MTAPVTRGPLTGYHDDPGDEQQVEDEGCGGQRPDGQQSDVPPAEQLPPAARPSLLDRVVHRSSSEAQRHSGLLRAMSSRQGVKYGCPKHVWG